MKAIESYFSIRLFEKLKEIAISLEGNEEIKAHISVSRLGRFWLLPIPCGILFWTIYTYVAIKIFSFDVSDTILFILILPYFLLILALVILIVRKDMVLVYSWKEFVYYPLIVLFEGIVIFIFSIISNSNLSETHPQLVLFAFLSFFMIPIILLLYIGIRTILINKRHPFMALILAVLKTVIWIFFLLSLHYKKKTITNKKD